MKKNYLLHLFLILYSISYSKNEDINTPPDKAIIPFEEIELNDLSNFKSTSKNWCIAKNTFIDKTQKQILNYTKGKGVLVNVPNKKIEKDIVTKLKHGDIELELDLMIPVGSNSGIFLQGRYEIQLADSWNKKKLTIEDMGSINKGIDSSNKGAIPLLNMSKSPGLWQHLTVVFHAPKFNKSGDKIKNALFEKVILNNVVIIKDTEVPNFTDGALFKNENALGPLMFQGGNGSIAFKNIRYKLYDPNKIIIETNSAKIYNSPKKLKDLASIQNLKLVKNLKNATSISPLSNLKKNAKNLLVYQGTLDIPKTADYLFEMQVNGGGFLAIDNNVLINMNKGGDEISAPEYSKRKLKKGKTPFTIAYNKTSSRKFGFELFVEGTNIQRQSLQIKNLSQKAKKLAEMRFILIEKSNKTVTQRSFLMHNNTKRTHCLSVGFPQSVNYSYDLETGSLLQIWSLGFFNATHMWHSRGKAQIGIPEGPVINFHGSPDFAFLTNKNSDWPKTLPKNVKLIQKGYKLDQKRNPLILNEINDVKISNKLVPSDTERKLNRQITVESEKEIWHKIAEGDKIELLSNNTYIINNQSFFIDFSDNKNSTPILRSKNGMDELLVKIPAGKQTINYSIIW